MTPNLEERYAIVREEDGSWSVIDTYTELAVVIRGEALAFLEHANAVGLAEILNREELVLSRPIIH
ncbi:hypothetical protein [Neorhizobium sp. DT-125]|uniref:hypothetical protein n=1 Tax=Neorhizobium sp. DT-125 TaxID=3396163 RepID=UPI003F1D6AC8